MPLFAADPSWPDAYVDITAPLTLRDGSADWIDLELDLARYGDDVRILDEDEFEECVAVHGLPSNLADGARRACAEVRTMLRERIEPFDRVGTRWLERFIDSLPERAPVKKYEFPSTFLDVVEEQVVGRDNYGRWHGVRADPNGYDFDSVVCYPADRWMCAVVAAPNSFPDGDREVYVHIAQPLSVLSGGSFGFVDLDLDVIRYRDGRVIVKDDDKFVAFGYPEDIARHAREACGLVVEMLERREEPFGDIGATWLAEFTGR